MKILTKQQIVVLHSHLIESSGGISGLRDEGLLESAIQSPFQHFNSQYLYPSIQAKAVRLGIRVDSKSRKPFEQMHNT